MVNKNKITNEDLAQIVASGFTHIDEQFKEARKDRESIRKSLQENIENLARMVAIGFAEAQEDREMIQVKLDKVEDRQVAQENRADYLHDEARKIKTHIGMK